MLVSARKGVSGFQILGTESWELGEVQRPFDSCFPCECDSTGEKSGGFRSPLRFPCCVFSCAFFLTSRFPCVVIFRRFFLAFFLEHSLLSSRLSESPPYAPPRTLAASSRSFGFYKSFGTAWSIRWFGLWDVAGIACQQAFAYGREMPVLQDSLLLSSIDSALT